MAIAKVLTPTIQVTICFSDNPRRRFEAVPARGQFAESIPNALHRLATWAHMQIAIRSSKDRTFIPQCEAKKIQPFAGDLMETNDVGFFSIDCQTKTAFERCFRSIAEDACLDSGQARRSPSAYRTSFRLGPNGPVRLTDRTEPRTSEGRDLPIAAKSRRLGVCQQSDDDGSCDHARRFPQSGFATTSEQGQDTAVTDAMFQCGHQLVMRNRIEINPSGQRHTLPVSHLRCVHESHQVRREHCVRAETRTSCRRSPPRRLVPESATLPSGPLDQERSGCPTDESRPSGFGICTRRTGEGR